MARTTLYFLLTSTVLGVIAVPGLAAFGLVLVPLTGAWLVWRVALTVVTRDHPSEAVVYVKRSKLLGPGGPDDSFAGLDDGEYPTEAQLGEIVQRVRDGRPRTNIGTVAPLDDPVAAFNPTGLRPKGNTIFTVRP
jgi:hypothetical protein